MLTIYRHIIRTKIDYGCIAYHTAKSTTIKPLNVIQNTAMRLATGAFRTSPSTSLQIITGELPLADRRALFIFKYVLKIMTCPKHPVHTKLFQLTNNKITLKSNNTTTQQIQNLLTTFSITLPEYIHGDDVQKYPPWIISEPNFNMELSKFSKANTNKNIYLQEYRKLQEQLQDHTTIYTDASKHEDAIGVATIINNHTSKFKILNPASVYTGEMFAICKSLELLKEHHIEDKNIVIYTDSLSSLQSIYTLYPKKQIAQQIQNNIHELQDTSRNNIKFIWIPSHIGIKGNEDADQAANEAIECETEINSNQLTDIISDIKIKIKEKWERLWKNQQTNKLRLIKDTTKVWKTYGNRKEQTITNRLRIGHTRLTHSHIFRREEPPRCNRCNTTVTVKHLLIECPKYNTQRITHQISPELKTVLGDNEIEHKKLIQYLEDTGLMHQI